MEECKKENEMIKRICAVTGGKCEDSFVEEYIEKTDFEVLIAVDSGMDFFVRTKRRPDIVLGDFDSISDEARAVLGLENFRGDLSEKGAFNVQKTEEICLKAPVFYFDEDGADRVDSDGIRLDGRCVRFYKDGMEVIVFDKRSKLYTDTETAVFKAMELNADELHILAGTGGRLDQLFGILQSMAFALDNGVVPVLADSKNRIRMISGDFEINKDDCFGKYVSLIPWGGDVRGIRLEGFKYDVSSISLSARGAGGISNEVKGKTARVSFEEGILLFVESED